MRSGNLRGRNTQLTGQSVKRRVSGWEGIEVINWVKEVTLDEELIRWFWVKDVAEVGRRQLEH